ncbi:2-dehydro-3-deoxy-D-gluconate 5-dehydrogenase KduD [Alkalihalobacillus pseudalcaliphilus]|uniref:2-dehydro-3-deoxy-D-gluconate 5-dehydrogenase KduD n=1 Tax=Alkalihalobacillus pseudalcaliphilus TaxID=79884 RepID=UPI00064DE1B2|nr:2-dehydro-3-deoxy-D-gluconate 5-dehydrogenase KduD [Alkalihalobacillus pseudalcaliphilus]KMK74387.1 3-ketoacyl-ACP reductase [Alkalihalobacillus pseudalcaliphilus]
MNFSLEGKYALVTGASRGLGQGMAIGLAKAGATVIGAGVSEMKETKEKIEALGGIFHSVQADLSSESGAKALVEEILANYENVDILVNNAGIIKREDAKSFSDSDFRQVLQVNLDSLFTISRELGGHMLQRGSGSIINIASMLSFQGGLRVPAYTASKHAVAGLTKALANEWGKQGVRVNAIAPGYMVTDNTEGIRNDADRNAYISSRIPMGEWGTPEDLEGPVVFLASDASSYVNGHVLCVDGGWMSS